MSTHTKRTRQQQKRVNRQLMHYDASGINNVRTITGNLCTVPLVELTEKHSRMRWDKLDATIGKMESKEVKMGNYRRNCRVFIPSYSALISDTTTPILGNQVQQS